MHLFQTVFDQAAIGIELVGPDGRLLRANAAVCEMLGYTEEELVGRSFAELIHPDDLPQVQALAGRLLAGEIARYRIEKRYVRKDGAAVWVRVTSSLVRNGTAEPYRLSIVEDIGERKQAEEVRKASEERFRTLTELSPDGVLINADGQFTYANPAALRLLGAKRAEEVLGRSPFGFILPEYHDLVRARIAQVLQGISAPLVEVGFRRLDGSEIAVEVTADPNITECLDP